MSICENIARINEIKNKAAARSGRNPEDVTLIAVTKLHAPDEINEAIRCGITDIGENKVQEILDKYDKVDKVRWHLIGHLQTNKVKYIIDKVDLIHSVDSLHLAKEIDKRAGNIGRIMDILVQVNPADEESKFGASTGETEELISAIRESCANIRIMGLMCIAPLMDDTELCRPYFAEVKSIFDRHDDFKYLSMGMSNDFDVAVEEGSNMIRVGTAIFGHRNYRQEEK